jgi:hypothetical protein
VACDLQSDAGRTTGDDEVAHAAYPMLWSIQPSTKAPSALARLE